MKSESAQKGKLVCSKNYAAKAKQRSVVSSAPTILRPRVRIPSTPSMLFKKKQSSVPHMFECWNNSVVHLLLLKSSMAEQISDSFNGYPDFL